MRFAPHRTLGPLLSHRACNPEIRLGCLRTWHVEVIVTPPNCLDVRRATIEIDSVLLSVAGVDLEVVGVSRLVRESQVDISSKPTRPLTIDQYLISICAHCLCQRDVEYLRVTVCNDTVTYGVPIDSCLLVDLHARTIRSIWGIT